MVWAAAAAILPLKSSAPVQPIMTPWAGKRSPLQILGAIDAMKLRSSLTLFDAMQPGDLFERALNAFFDSPDEHTLALLDGAE